MRARLPRFAAALVAAVALVSGPLAVLAGTGTASAVTADSAKHWYDSATQTPGA